MAYTPAKLNHGDPLFAAATRNEQNEEDHEFCKNNSKRGTYDPIYMDLMIHSPKSTSAIMMMDETAAPLHSYYSEFRLGQGDPLMKAAMRRWGPCATIMEGDDEDDELSAARQRRRMRSCGVLTVPPCRALSDPSRLPLPHDMLHIDNVGHLEHPEMNEEERRFILLSDERRFVMME